METPSLVKYLRAMGYTVTHKGKNAHVSLAADDVSKQDVTELMDSAHWSMVSKLIPVRHRDDDSFDTVKITFR